MLQEVERGAVGVARASKKVAEALKRIGRVNELVVQLGIGNERLPLKEHCVEALALSEAAAVDPVVKQKRAELQVALNSAELLIQATFLAARGRIGINCKRLSVGGVIWVSEPT